VRMFTGLLLIAIVIAGLLAVGAVAGVLSQWLDDVMDFGMVFGGVRFYFAKKAANEAQLKVLEAASRHVDFSNRLRTVNDIYWLIATTTKWFTVFMCTKCFSTYVWLVLYVTTVLASGINWRLAAWCALPSFLITYKVLK